MIDGEWHHAALTVIERGNLQDGQTTLYVDGRADSTFSGSGNIYNLTAEIRRAWSFLIGRVGTGVMEPD